MQTMARLQVWLTSLSFFFITLTSHSHSHSHSNSPTSIDRYIKPSLPTSPQEYIEIDLPHPSDSHSYIIFQHDFANTLGSPPITLPYHPPPDLPSTISRLTLRLHATCKGEQYDRIAAVWLHGVEILRTSTAEPTDSGIFWNVLKDVTKYSTLLSQHNLNLTVMLENVVNDVFTGVYHVQLFLIYSLSRVPPFIQKFGSNNDPGFPSADLILPISDDGDQGFWFRINGGSRTYGKWLRIPENTRRAVIEIYASFHGDDEFWYSNPPDSYIRANNLSTGRGHGAFREVLATVDGDFVGSEFVFPVIFTGGINPLFWEPIVSIGAFDLPSYEIEITPFLGLLLDGKPHYFGLQIIDGISFWLVDANLHLWLDPEVERVHASPVFFESSELSIDRRSESMSLDGVFEIKAKRKSEASCWLNSSFGNITIEVSRELEIKNTIEFRTNGTSKSVKQKIQANTKLNARSSETRHLVHREHIERSYPLHVITLTHLGKDDGTRMIVTNVSHALNENSIKSLDDDGKRTIMNSQDSDGWMLIKDHSVLSGFAKTKQSLRYRDEASCYSRGLSAIDGKIVKDKSSSHC